MAEIQMDIDVLLECVKCQQDSPQALSQSLMTLSTLITDEKTKDHFRESGGLKYVYSVLLKTESNEIKIAALFCLASVVDKNVFSQKMLTEPSVFCVTHGILKELKTSRKLHQAVIYFILCLVANNSQAQNLTRETGCLADLMAIFRQLLCDMNHIKEDGRQVGLVASALSVCVNNPQNDENQRLCSPLLPYIFNILNQVLTFGIVSPLLSLTGLVVANNVFNQDRVRKCGGLDVLMSCLCSLTVKNFQDDDSLTTAVQIVGTLDLCLSDNESNIRRFREVCGIMPLIFLLSPGLLSQQEQLQIVIALSHVLNSTTDVPCSLTHGDYQQLISLLTQAEDEELIKALKYVLHICKNSDKSDKGEEKENDEQFNSRKSSHLILSKIDELVAKLETYQEESRQKTSMIDQNNSNSNPIANTMIDNQKLTKHCIRTESNNKKSTKDQRQNNSFTNVQEVKPFLMSWLKHLMPNYFPTEQVNNLPESFDNAPIKEPVRDMYEFSRIRNNLMNCQSHGSKNPVMSLNTEPNGCDINRGVEHMFQSIIKSPAASLSNADCYRHQAVCDGTHSPVDTTLPESDSLHLPDIYYQHDQSVEANSSANIVGQSQALMHYDKNGSEVEKEDELTHVNNHCQGKISEYNQKGKNHNSLSHSGPSMVEQNGCGIKHATFNNHHQVYFNSSQNWSNCDKSNETTANTIGYTVSEADNNIFETNKKNNSAYRSSKFTNNFADSNFSDEGIKIIPPCKVRKTLAVCTEPSRRVSEIVSHRKVDKSIKQPKKPNLANYGSSQFKTPVPPINNATFLRPTRAPVRKLKTPSSCGSAKCSVGSRHNVRILARKTVVGIQNCANSYSANNSPTNVWMPSKDVTPLPSPSCSEFDFSLLRSAVCSESRRIYGHLRPTVKGLASDSVQCFTDLQPSQYIAPTFSEGSSLLDLASVSDSDTVSESTVGHSADSSLGPDTKDGGDEGTRLKKSSNQDLCPGCFTPKEVLRSLMNSRTYNIVLETSQATCQKHRKIRNIERQVILKHKSERCDKKTRPLPELNKQQNGSSCPPVRGLSVYDFNSNVGNSEFDGRKCVSPLMASSLWSKSPNIPAHLYERKKKRNRALYSEEEILNLLHGVENFGRRWSHILVTYKFHSSRTAVDLKEKYNRLMKKEHALKKPQKKRKPFSMCEERRLRRGVRALGYNWKGILQMFQFARGRTADELRNKWRTMNMKS